MSAYDGYGYVPGADPYAAAQAHATYGVDPNAAPDAGLIGSELEHLSLADDHSSHALVNDLLDGDDIDYEDDEDFEDAGAASEFACAYCGISNTSCVAQCVKTGKWFCNGRSNGLPASCLIYHCVKSKSKEVRLHETSPLGDMLLECYVTGETNVFNLGFIPCKDENVVVLTTRDAALRKPAELKELNLDLSLWEPLIQDKVFLPWLLQVPEEGEALRARRVDTAKANRLEELWKTNPDATLDEIGEHDAGEELDPVALTYEDAYQYQNIFGPLIKAEADYDKAQRESQTKDGVTVRWDVGLNRRRIAYFCFSAEESLTSVNLGDSLQLRLMIQTPNGPQAWQGQGVVIKFTAQEEVGLEMYSNDAPIEYTTGYSVDFLWKGTSYDRAQQALKSFAVDDTSCSGYVYHKLLGHPVDDQELQVDLDKKLTAPGLPELNQSQLNAVREVLKRPLSLVQGPPGTGKTVTSATIVYHLAHRGNGQVIVVAPSNVAVDHLAEKIEKTGLKVVRISSRSREHLFSSIEHLTLHSQVANVGGPTHKAFQKLQQLKNELGELSAGDEKKYRLAQKKLEREILENADVICTTAVGAGDPRLANFRFRMVLIDESTQATEPECLIPIVMGAKQVVMVGDHLQLGPVVTCKQAHKMGLAQSLFERLIELGIKPIRLQIQYRMHPCLSEFPSNMFYDGELQNGVSAYERTLTDVDFPWPVPSKPMMFWSQTGQEEMSASGTSYLNRAEASAVEKCVTQLLNSGVSPEQIGVVTPYEGQRAYVVQHMTRVGVLHPQLYKDIQVASVDSFQGKEKDFIIMTCVRSNEKSGIGFLSSPRRLNVAITRARSGLIIVGNPKVLNKQSLFHDMLVHFRENSCLVEGPLTSLKECMVALPEPFQAVKDPWAHMKNKRGGRGGRGGRGDRGGANAESNQRFDFPSHGSGYWYGRFGDFYKDTDVQSESEFSYAHSEVGSEFSYQPPSEAAPGRAYEY
jgi:regulator of nonsense transcripts 1